jgi:hypothetical protein
LDADVLVAWILCTQMIDALPIDVRQHLGVADMYLQM